MGVAAVRPAPAVVAAAAGGGVVELGARPGVRVTRCQGQTIGYPKTVGEYAYFRKDLTLVTKIHQKIQLLFAKIYFRKYLCKRQGGGRVMSSN